MRFDELAERWIIDMKGTVSCNTYRYGYQNAVYNHLMPCFKDKEIDAIRLADMQHFFTEMGKRYKRDTLNKVRMIAKKMFEYAIDNEYISGRNPVTNVVLPADDNDSYEVKSFTDEQLGYIVDFSQDHRFGAEILFIAETGVRKSEMLGARWSDYSSEGRYIKILRSVAEVKKENELSSSVVVKKTKNRSSTRMIPLTDEMCKVLDGLPRTSEYIFPTQKGTVQRPSTWTRKHYNVFFVEMRNYYSRHGISIPFLSPHKFRHTRASIWVNSKANIYAVAKVLGHSDITMLHKCYAHSDVEQLRNLLDMQ